MGRMKDILIAEQEYLYHLEMTGMKLTSKRRQQLINRAIEDEARKRREQQEFEHNKKVANENI